MTTPTRDGEELVHATAEAAANVGAVNVPSFQWRPIETAPKDGSHVLLSMDCDPPAWVAEGYYEADDDRGWFRANTHWTDAHDGSLDPTHWMPLPRPRGDRTDASEAQSGDLNHRDGVERLPDDEVICPACAHHFRAVSQQDQDLIASLRSENERLRAVCENFEITGPDADGLVWLVLHGKGTSGRGMINLGTADRVWVQVVQHLEQDRKAALSTEASNGNG